MEADTKAAPGGLPPFLQPTLRLFLSVDIANSTAFKQANAFGQTKNSDPERLVERWFSPIAEFYWGMQSDFDNEIANYKASGAWLECTDQPETPRLWRTLGDEIIYVVPLRYHCDAIWFVEAWLRAIKRQRAVIIGRSPNLDLKGSAWIAGFPVNNAEVALEIEKDDLKLAEGDPILANLLCLDKIQKATTQSRIDYIGPSIDTGFRLAKQSTPRKFMLAIDLAYLMAKALYAMKERGALHFSTHQFRYEGRVSLKGITDGEPYPLFWLDTADGSALHAAEDKLLSLEAATPSAVISFCDEYFKGKAYGHVMKPYIYNETADGDEIPLQHLQRLQKLDAYWRQEGEKRQIETKAMLEDTAPTDSLPPAVAAPNTAKNISLLLDAINVFLKK